MQIRNLFLHEKARLARQFASYVCIRVRSKKELQDEKTARTVASMSARLDGQWKVQQGFPASPPRKKGGKRPTVRYTLFYIKEKSKEADMAEEMTEEDIVGDVVTREAASTGGEVAKGAPKRAAKANASNVDRDTVLEVATKAGFDVETGILA